MPLALSNAAEIESLGIGEVIKVLFVFILFVIVSFITMPSGALTERIKYYKFNLLCIVLLLMCSFISAGPVYAFMKRQNCSIYSKPLSLVRRSEMQGNHF